MIFKNYLSELFTYNIEVTETSIIINNKVTFRKDEFNFLSDPQSCSKFCIKIIKNAGTSKTFNKSFDTISSEASISKETLIMIRAALDKVKKTPIKPVFKDDVVRSKCFSDLRSCQNDTYKKKPRPACYKDKKRRDYCYDVKINVFGGGKKTDSLKTLTVKELKAKAKALELKRYSKLNKPELVTLLKKS